MNCTLIQTKSETSLVLPPCDYISYTLQLHATQKEKKMDYVLTLRTQAAALMALKSESFDHQLRTLVNASPMAVMKNQQHQIEQQQRFHAEGSHQHRQRMLRQQIKRALQTVSLLFVALQVVADTGIELSSEQLFLVREIWASCLPTIVGGEHIYKIIKDEIAKRFGLVYNGKGHSMTIGRRAGKSFSTMLATSIMGAVCMQFRPAILNLYFAAGSVNLQYMMEFVSILEKDPKHRIRCKFLGKERQYYIHVRSHMQYMTEEDNLRQPECYVHTPEYNELCSLPNMDTKGGSVRSCFFFF
jgi:hypothetical protein